MWLGWDSCNLFPTPNGSQPTKSYLPWGKVAQMPLLPNLSWVGLALGWGVNKRFHNHIYNVFQPNIIW